MVHHMSYSLKRMPTIGYVPTERYMRQNDSLCRNLELYYEYIETNWNYTEYLGNKSNHDYFVSSL